MVLESFTATDSLWEAIMMLGWNAYRDQINSAVREMAAANPDIVRAYAGFNQANAESTRIDAKTRELIALGVAVTLRCDGSINVHTDTAIKAGATKEEVVDTLGVAIMVNAGAAMVYSARKPVNCVDGWHLDPASEALLNRKDGRPARARQRRPDECAEYRHPSMPPNVILPFVGIRVPMQLANCAGASPSAPAGGSD
jgi:AhpD family alkylhydroperoxidase